MSDQKYVCVDLDGTIAHYKEWVEETHFGEPVAGVQAAFTKLRAAGWKIIIYTTRGNQELVRDYLETHSIPFDSINRNPDQPANATGGKPIADVYVDDRGIQFNGDWPATVDEVLKFVPWENRTETKPEDSYAKEATAFLGRDYEQVFDQLRYYDTQMWDIFKFSFAQLIASIAGVWTIFSLANGKDAPEVLKAQWELVSAAILIISFIFGMLAIQLIMRNRVYFSDAARYINDQRGFFLASKPIGFSNRSNFYTDPTYPKSFDKDSTQYVWVVVLSWVGALILGFGIGLLLEYFGLIVYVAIAMGVLIWVFSAMRIVAYTQDYLEEKKYTSTASDG
ncbi:MAG TPA: hypothetical protein VK206_01375 [Anaerolineales bacterium]|nr:hypothetical protein [Anaerolineales bacterium]